MWKSTGIHNYSSNSNMTPTAVANNQFPELKTDGRMHVYLNGNYFVQNKAIISNNNNLISIYCVYQLDPISSSRDTTYTIQNALFGAVQITKNADASKYAYKEYGICFDEGGMFSEGSINNGRNTLIFGVHESFLIHSNNKANNIYVMGKEFVQGINDTTLYADKVYSQNFTQPSKKFVLSLHYNGDNSYLFANGTQEFKFKAKNYKILKNEKLCLRNLSNQWRITEYKKTGLYGNIYDFVVDYEAINGVKQIYDMYRYLMKKMILYKMFLINLFINVFNVLKVKTLEYVSVINEKCMSRPKIINDDINDPMTKLCVPNIVKDMNIKVFNLLARNVKKI